jgi:hypothetical protein
MPVALLELKRVLLQGIAFAMRSGVALYMHHLL